MKVEQAAQNRMVGLDLGSLKDFMEQSVKRMYALKHRVVGSDRP